MTKLELTLLGMPQIKLDDQLISNLPSRKARALLIYLALTKQTHSRQHLAGFLWGEMTEENARRNLRVLLTRLRKHLQPFLNIQRRELSINLDSDVWIDVVEFESCLASPDPTLQQLHRAAKLYQGHFLDGFDVRDALSFEEWQRPLREHYRQKAMDALYRLAVYHTKQKQYSQGIDFTGQLLALEPWMEEAHRQMMLLHALSGQRIAALTQYETCRDVLMEEIGVAPSEATNTLYQQILNEEIDADMDRPAIIPSPEPVTWTPPFQTPAAPPHFVGRAVLQNDIIKAMHAHSTPPTEANQTVPPQLHALVGMGGIGKSALAIQLAHSLREAFPDGVLWANVAASEPMSILESWAQLYGYDFTRIADVENMAAAFRSALAEKSVLIVLDDVTSAARIRPLLPTGDQNQVLLTTRDQDLAYALHATVWPLEELSESNGSLLFTHLLGEERVNAEPDAATQICNLLQNLPLAVEITAQRLKSRPRRKLLDVATRLKDETNRLSMLNISDQSVRASFGLSWETLDAGLREVFCVMGLFNGRSFTASTIAYIIDQDSYLTEDRLFALTNLSLVSEEGQTRYRQHALLADFAREKLEGSEMEGDNGRFNQLSAGRLAQHYLQFAQRHPHDYDILRPEWDNMMAAMQTAHDHQLWQPVIDFADALHDAWFTRGRYDQARRAYALAQKAAQVAQDDIALANIFLHWGEACIEQNDYKSAETHLITSYELFSNLKYESGIANTQFHRARIAIERSQYAQASSFLAECQQIWEALMHTKGVAAVLYRQSRIAYRTGGYDEAHQLAKRALNIQETQDRLGASKTLRLMASIVHEQRNYSLEKIYCEKALNISDKLQDRGELAPTYHRLCWVSRQLGELNQAQIYGENSLKLSILIGDKKLEGLSLYVLSIIYEDKKEFDAALKLGLQSLKLLRAVMDAYNQVYILAHLGDIYQNLQQFSQMNENWQKALTLADQQNHPERERIGWRLMNTADN